MRKITLFIASSLDNYIAREDGEIDWLFSDQDYGYKKFYDSVDTVLLGRKTYETAIKLGEKFSGKTVYVFSKKDLEKTNNVEFVKDPLKLVKKLINNSGKGIFLEGGSDIISVFLNECLIDEIILSIHPILLGKGIPLFKNVKKELTLNLLESTNFESGLVQLHYMVLKK